MKESRFVDGYLGYLLGQANHALYKDFDARVRAAGLTGIEWRVLATLHDGEPLTVSQLAQDVLSKQPTVTKLVQRMADEGLLVLRADPQDQRRTLVAASEAGLKAARILITEARAQEQGQLAHWSASEVDALKRMLQRLAAGG